MLLPAPFLDQARQKNTTVNFGGAPWNEDRARAHAAAGGLPDEAARWGLGLRV